jgi:hypothetical protein
MVTSKGPPLSPQEGWLSDGRKVLHFRPTRWSRHNQMLEVTSGELTPEEAINLWDEKRQEGWKISAPQWQPPPPPSPP